MDTITDLNYEQLIHIEKLVLTDILPAKPPRNAMEKLKSFICRAPSKENRKLLLKNPNSPMVFNQRFLKAKAED